MKFSGFHFNFYRTVFVWATFFALEAFITVSTETIGKECNDGGKTRTLSSLKYCSSLNKGNLQSNYQSGKDDLFVCCPDRISSIKCNEYQRSLEDNLVTLSLIEPPRSKELKCPNIFNQPLIVGGRTVQLKEFPHVVALKYASQGGDERSSYKCGGTLISPKFVLTAAHCLQNGSPLAVLLGDIKLIRGEPNDLTPGSVERKEIEIEKIYLHPKYDPPATYNDIALVELKKEVKLNPAIRPACLPPTFPNWQLPGKELKFTASGWGQNGTYESATNILQAVNLHVVPNYDCNLQYQDSSEQLNFRIPQGIIQSSQICAGGGGNDTCLGDSGGPLTTSFIPSLPCIHYVVGITSFGGQSCGYGSGVYTRVIAYLDWIEAIVWHK